MRVTSTTVPTSRRAEPSLRRVPPEPRRAAAVRRSLSKAPTNRRSGAAGAWGKPTASDSLLVFSLDLGLHFSMPLADGFHVVVLRSGLHVRMLFKLLYSCFMVGSNGFDGSPLLEMTSFHCFDGFHMILNGAASCFLDERGPSSL